MTSTRRTFGREERPSIGELVSQLSEKLSALIRNEIQLAKTEVASKAKHAAVAIGLLVGAAALAFLGLGVLLAFFVILLDLWLPTWAAALIVTVVLFAVAAVLGVLGVKRLERGVPPTPDRAQANIKLDVEAVKEGLQ